MNYVTELILIIMRVTVAIGSISMSSLFDILFSAEHWLDANFSSAGFIAIPAIITALLMPIAIFLMERQDKYEFDKSVIVDKILCVRWLIPGIILSSVTLLYHCSLLSLVGSLVLMMITGFVLIHTYKWTKSYEATTDKITYRQQKRLNYLEGLKTDNDKLEVWTSIFNDGDLLEKNQQGLVSKYIKSIKSMKDTDDKYPLTNMNLLLIRNLNKINLSNRESYDELLNYSLDYFNQYQAWKMYKKNDKATKPKRPEYYLKELFERIMQISLNDDLPGGVLDYLFFEQIKKNIALDTVDESIFAKCFLSMYFKFLDANKKSVIDKLWVYINDWTITRKRLEGEQTKTVSLNLLQAYIDTIVHKVHKDIKLFSHEANIIDETTENLLPNINPILWFDIVSFYTIGWGIDKDEDNLHAQIRNYTERGRNFGLIASSGLVGWNGYDNNTSPEVKSRSIWKEQNYETIYILGIIFPWLKNPAEVQKVVDKTKSMLDEKDMISDDRHKMRLQKLHGNFLAILDFINDENKIA